MSRKFPSISGACFLFHAREEGHLLQGGGGGSADAEKHAAHGLEALAAELNIGLMALSIKEDMVPRFRTRFRRR